jgi:hypothetical protein
MERPVVHVCGLNPDGFGTSLWATGRWLKTYAIGQITTPEPGSYLYALPTLQDAQEWVINAEYQSNFRKNWPNLCVLQCVADVVSTVTVAQTTTEEKYFQEFWMKWHELSGGETIPRTVPAVMDWHGVPIFDAPKKTVFCRWIKPIRQTWLH